MREKSPFLMRGHICFFTSIYTSLPYADKTTYGHWGNVFCNLIGMHACMYAEFGEGQRGAVVNCDQDLPIIRLSKIGEFG